MEFTNDNLLKMKDKKLKYNTQYSRWYHSMSLELDSKIYKNKSDRILDCMNLWQWDMYEKNKLLDLQKVNRCSNNRFCPNCKLLDISKFIHEFKNVYTKYLQEGYKAYMLTLTIPSVSGNELRPTLDKLNKCFGKLTEKFTYDISDSKSYKDRYFKIDGGIKVLEITHNDIKGYHPHFHCVVFVNDDILPHYLEKNIIGKYSYKRQSYNAKSLIDIQLGKLWSMIWYGDRLSKKNIDSIVYDPRAIYYSEDKKCLEVDFMELDENGIYEVFKYTFKDADVTSYKVFKTLVQALDKKRIRQGFGILYNMKCEEIDAGEVQELEIVEKENPSVLLTREINELITTYRDYKKISRFNRQVDNNIKD